MIEQDPNEQYGRGPGAIAQKIIKDSGMDLTELMKASVKILNSMDEDPMQIIKDSESY